MKLEMIFNGVKILSFNKHEDYLMLRSYITNKNKNHLDVVIDFQIGFLDKDGSLKEITFAANSGFFDDYDFIGFVYGFKQNSKNRRTFVTTIPNNFDKEES